MTVLEIVKAYLVEHNCDGLCNDECGCGLDDFAPCFREFILDCKPSKKIIATKEQAEECGCDEGETIYVEAEEPFFNDKVHPLT